MCPRKYQRLKRASAKEKSEMKREGRDAGARCYQQNMPGLLDRYKHRLAPRGLKKTGNLTLEAT
eukprot:1157410-Pelagomonas_calceolata.AAC.1